MGVCCVRDDTRLLAKVAADGSPGRGLDLGTGSGYVGIYLAQRGWQVDAVDVSPRALELARHNVERNGVTVRVFRSDLFQAIEGLYDVIACNPPMRANETETSRLISATLRRIGFLANLLPCLTLPLLERRRLGLLVEIARGARAHLAPGGRLILVISAWEAARLLQVVPGLVCRDSRPIGSIPGLNVVTFVFGEVTDTSR